MNSKNTQSITKFNNIFSIQKNHQDDAEDILEMFSKMDPEIGYKYYIYENKSEELARGYFWFCRYTDLFLSQLTITSD